MSAFNQPGQSWQEFAASSMAECEKARQLSLQSRSLGNGRWSSGECASCGAIWHEHSLQNALAKGAGECSYCRSPRHDRHRPMEG